MITALKIIFTLAIILLMSYPFITVKGKMRKLFVGSSLRYYEPHTRKNIFFVLLSIAEFIVVVLLFKVFDNLAKTVISIPFVGSLLSNAINSVNSQIDYIFLAVKIVLINLVMIYAFVFLKAILKKVILNPLFKISKDKKKFSLSNIFRKRKKANKESDTDKKNTENKLDNKASDSTAEEDEIIRKRRRIPDFVHSMFRDDDLDNTDHTKNNDSDTVANTDGSDEQPQKRQYGRIASRFLSLFFEGDEFQYARVWVIRTRMILQSFIHLVELLYVILLAVLLAAVFFALPMPMYNLLINVLHVGEWYLYPAISIIFLQEICNTFDLPAMDDKIEVEKKKAEKKEDSKRDARIRALLAELKKRFDSEHSLRYYPEIPYKELPEYKCTNVMYASALSYIGSQMKQTSGRIVQSYMECLDAIYNDAHVYFPASFYSEIGEYLIAYTYIRLLSGARVIFVVSDPEEKKTLRTYISDRLARMTGSSSLATWRVYTASERLDQADVLIVTPHDFEQDNIVDQYPGFFEEASNAIFIDADKMISMDSYLCPIIATRLKKATNGRIRFVFLSLDLLKGFAARNLPKFFCVDKVLSFTSADENEAVSYVLWNKESKKRRIYNKNGQKPACLEIIIAEQAFHYGIDGVRLISESPLEHAERQVLAMHDVEINNPYKSRVDVNYMIYSDDRCNLAAALYACTRFRGLKKSVVHIISKPYLLREYFVSKSNTEDYINRSSFIQPRVTEHAENHKLSLLRVFCDATAEGGLTIGVFEHRMRSIIATQKEKGENVSSAYCRELIKDRDVDALKLSELAAYLVAGLCDNDPIEICEDKKDGYVVNSFGNRAKDFYLVIDPASQSYGSLEREKKIIFNRTKEVFSYVFACNKRVELRLNDEVIGLLDTFPGRVHLEYVVGQSIIYKNAEYEIEHISDDGSAIYLRHENISIRNCLDTILLRRYEMNSLTETGKTGVLNHSMSKLEEIRVSRCRASFTGTTYGFYSLTTDRQTIDFYNGVEGNPHVDHPHVRSFSCGNVLRVSLKARMDCTDGMRRLLAAVFNEFIRTIFPRAYRCVAICPVLAEPETDLQMLEDSPINRIKTLYPFIKDPKEEFIETDVRRMQFLFINDCEEDIGVLDWFFDPSGRYMQEFLANVYSYLHWLKIHSEKAHYIYFGGTALPECYDLEGCCELLGDFNFVLSDDGKKDFETAGDEDTEEKVECCSFCHKPMESGRFSFFDKNRFICADCFETVDDQSQLNDIYLSMREYLTNLYPEISFGSIKVKFDPVYDLTLDQILSEYYYRVDYADRTVFVEVDDPITNAQVSVLRGIIALWQSDNTLVNHYASAQLYYEELRYLRSLGNHTAADWTYHALPESIRALVDKISDYASFKDLDSDEDVTENTEENTENTSEENAEDDHSTKKDRSEAADRERRTSFSFMVLKSAELKDDDYSDEVLDDEDDDYSDGLYDANLVPRFWKRYLRGEKLDDGQEEDLSGAEEDVDLNSDEEGLVENLRIIEIAVPNAPSPETDENLSEPSPENTEEDPKKAEKMRLKEEKKRKREEKRRQKQLEWERSLDTIEEEEEKKRKGIFDDSDQKKKTEEKPKKKRGWSIFGKKKNKEDDDSTSKDTETKNDETDTDVGADTDTNTDTETDTDTDTDTGTDTTTDTDTDTDTSKNKKSGKGKKSRKKKGLFSKMFSRKRTAPHDDDEDSNPKIRLYNALVRAAYDYSEEPISREGVADRDLATVFLYVKHDYPELFWLDAYCYTATHISHRFRCKNANGQLDVKQIDRKRAELRKGAKPFIKGITKKTDPYEAVLTIYRRLILTLDYDSAGLNANAGSDRAKDDVLRSLHGALVEHKVVCAGYAVAMQYLLQAVGIVCGYVVSENNASGTCHAFNILKIGKYCYYLDATWGDSSTTVSDNNKDFIGYDYFCTPYKEFVRASPDSVPMHKPRREYYPTLEEFSYTNHEYFRYHNAYIKSYDEKELVRIFAEAALRYKPDEMGRFAVGFRCTDGKLAKYVCDMLSSKGKIFEIVRKAKNTVSAKNKKAAKLLDSTAISWMLNDHTGTVYYFIGEHSSKQNKKKK